MGPELILPLAALGVSSIGWALIPYLRTPLPAPERAGRRRLTVIIPARNEEHNLPRLLESLRRQPAPPDEVIVVDDASTDRTAAIARAHGARVISSAPLPDGWRGKPWACQQGADAAGGEILLFLDADTWFEAGGLDRALSMYAGGAFSLAPYHVIRKPYEELSMFFNILMALGAAGTTLFGPMLLVDRESYRRVGGHARAKERILENVWLGEAFREAGVPVHSGVGRGILSFRMYPGGVRELVEGWLKGFASGAGKTGRLRLFMIITWLTGLTAVALGCCVTQGAWPWAVAYGACVVQVACLARRVGSFGIPAAVLYPLPLLFFFALFLTGTARRGGEVSWKGRTIHAD
ncbi:glycosyltransferase family 2 protein [Limisphaera ngatamarikiensis]|uniref:Glycosyltransferase family 2 protein n=1 Tax=Limisphaera ngatamarikiensis TaxID=1324935 RepID=A0A6M1RQM5_9BACT|nr:glycosyltransferase family 2 protein [Limisphaera ngatamarikiensis]NGO38965.1 glycosyltransferase family 2 protein [Limisphaera ngatamarikiensis]